MLRRGQLHVCSGMRAALRRDDLRLSWESVGWYHAKRRACQCCCGCVATRYTPCLLQDLRKPICVCIAVIGHKAGVLLACNYLHALKFTTYVRGADSGSSGP